MKARFFPFLFLFIAISLQSLANKKLIVIDAAHGGEDKGASVESVNEKDIILSITNKLGKIETNDDFEIVLLREGDSYISLQERVEKINQLNADLVISIHVNYDNASADKNGIEAFVSTENKKYYQSLVDARGLLQSFSQIKLASSQNVLRKNIYVLKNVNCPAVALEIGYLSNTNDRAYITTEAGQNEIAKAIFKHLELR